MGDNLATQLCPCGFLGDRRNHCSCTSSQIQRYQSRISGPLLDRIDLHLTVTALQYDEMSGKDKGESSATIRKRVNATRKVQADRFADCPGLNCNGQMKTREIERFCELDSDASRLLEKGMEKLKLSARGYHRILKIARTIADMEHSEDIRSPHIAEAIQFRRSTL